MSKAELAQEAAREVKAQVRDVGFPAKELIAAIAPEYDVKPSVIEAWLLREFDSLAELDEWGAAYRTALSDRQRRRLEQIEAEARKFHDLGQTIDAIPHKGLLFASLNVVNNKWSATWRNWIEENCPTADEQAAAYNFARERFRTRRSSECDDSHGN